MPWHRIVRGGLLIKEPVIIRNASRMRYAPPAMYGKMGVIQE